MSFRHRFTSLQVCHVIGGVIGGKRRRLDPCDFFPSTPPHASLYSRMLGVIESLSRIGGEKGERKQDESRPFHRENDERKSSEQWGPFYIPHKHSLSQVKDNGENNFFYLKINELMLTSGRQCLSNSLSSNWYLVILWTGLRRYAERGRRWPARRWHSRRREEESESSSDNCYGEELTNEERVDN